MSSRRVIHPALLPLAESDPKYSLDGSIGTSL